MSNPAEGQKGQQGVQVTTCTAMQLLCGQGVESSVITLQEIKEKGFRFVIPSYQRPYVWSDDVMQLFNDIKEVCESEQQHYFIGTVLSSLVQTPSGENIYELVDGQQRTTTLMLICIAFKHAGIDSKLSDLAVYRAKEGDKGEPRLQFSIREQVQQLFGAKARLHITNSSTTECHRAVAKCAEFYRRT